MSTFTHEPAGFTISLDYDVTGKLIYFGKAAKGTPKSETKWTIAKFTYDSNSQLTDVQWAGGNNRFEHVWDDRVALTYS